MHKTQLYLEENQYLILRDWASKRKKSIAQLVREIIDVAIAAPPGRTPDSLFDIVGMAAGGYSNVAQRADDYLYGGPETVRGLEREGLARDPGSKVRRRKAGSR